MTSPLPDFFIIGAPRCGTTALCRYLGGHPEVFVAGVKEMHHFGADIMNLPEFKDRARYLTEFESAAGKKRIGEASVWYLYSELAAREMKQFNPASRIIVMLRNPVEMIVSLHAKLLLIGSETERDLGRALAREEERKDKVRLPDGTVPLRPFFYREVGQYSRRVERYLEEFGRERVHVMIYDDFQRDLAGEYRRTLAFLEVAPDFTPDFTPVNEHRGVRSLMLNRLLRAAPEWAWALRRKLLPRDFHPGRVLMRLNNPAAPRPVMEEEVRRDLHRELAPDVERLSELLGRDLSHWSK